MDTLITVLTDPKFLTIVGPLGIAAAIEAYAIYALFNRLEDLQEKRLQDWQAMRDEYTQLSKGVNSTLDTVLKVLGKKNGNGNGGCNG